MIKRINRLTALMAAATAVASIVPATSASASTKLETQEASIDSVQVFDGGKYVFDGYRTDDQDSATYYFDGSKDIEIEDVDGDDFVKYGKNFLNFNNSDETLFNLETGEVDEDTVEDKIAYMQTKFNTSVVKKVDRYEGSKLETITSEDQINADQFGDVWYGYKINSTTAYTGYISAEGTYIDASETANLVFYAKNADGKYEKLTFDEMDDVEKTSTGEAYALQAGETLGANADYIFRVVNVVEENSDVVLKSYIQKISKAQGEKVDGAYIPKSVATYEIESDLLDEINGADAYRFIKDSVYTVTFASNKITVNKLDLTRERDTDSEVTTDRVYKVKLDEDYDDVQGEDAYDFDIDVDGNVWVLYKGNIQKVVNGKLTTMYTTDRTMNEISVYDDNDIVVWNAKDDIFASVSGKSESSDNEAEEDKEEITAGWVKNSDGTWSYNKADGTKATGWLNLNGTWYYLNANGIMQTGWLNLSGTWYYLESSGAMKTGWLNDRGTWYYLESSGAMKTGWLNDRGTWYYLESSGAMKTGWLNDNGTWYYLNASGAMLANQWFKDTDGRWYYLQASGAMATNTVIDGYRVGANGAWIQ